MRRILLFVLLVAAAIVVRAQYNVDRLIRVAQSALYYEDYVLSIQYFSRAITAKPYLYEPWFGRGEAKFRLDDFVGAEADLDEAIKLNPYVPVLFELRGLCRIHQNNFAGAITDYDKTIEYNPDNRSLWFNRALCRIENHDYEAADKDLQTMMDRWKDYSQVYSLKAELLLKQKDTVQASGYLDKSLELNPYDGNAWAVRSMISLAMSDWKKADTQLSKAIHFKPTNAGYYVNRALARYKLNNLRGALADYDKAVELEPNNFLAHYNRGQMRMQVGDYNRAVEDFDYVIRLEPNNVMAIYNRALLLERIGELRGAVRDYSTLISQFPNFWVGLANRARCYRRLGMKAKAENDEFRIFKAQVDKSNGFQPRWSRKHIASVRKRSEIDFDKYNELVVDDNQQVGSQYENSYRGKVQNRKVDVELMPMFQLSYLQYTNGVKSYMASDGSVDKLNMGLQKGGLPIQVTCNPKPLGETDSHSYLALIDSLSARIDATHDLKRDKILLMQRAVAYSVTLNYYDAENDLSAYLQIDSLSVPAYWQRAVCFANTENIEKVAGQMPAAVANGADKVNAVTVAGGQRQTQKALADVNEALRLGGDNAYLYYNRGNLYAMMKDWQKAADDYSKAIALDASLAEAYYNRGLVRAYAKKTEQAIKDLSRAGELGLVDAYGAIKKYSAKTQKK